MTDFTTLLGKQINIQLSGKKSINGILIDVGKDILVLFNGQRFLYIPLFHVHHIRLNSNKEEQVDLPSESPVVAEMDSLSYNDVLTNAKGKFIEMNVAKKLTFYGYITDVLSDYVAFYSPIYKVVFIPISHIKWLIPYNQNTTPYTPSNEQLTDSKSHFHLKVNPSNVPLLLFFEDQLKKEVGKLVLFDGGANTIKVGLLKKAENNFAELVLATSDTVCLKLSHIKSVHFP